MGAKMGAKKNIYLVQVDVVRKLPTRRIAYLPYAVGALWAYAKQAPAVASSYALREIFFLRDPVPGVAACMEAPFLVGFSCYSWNTEYNKALAQAVKKRFPDCLILFGGHNVPPGSSMLEALPYVDYLIHGEGEIGFQALLKELCKAEPDFAAIPGFSYRAKQTTATNAEAYAESVWDFPSPYLEGIFDPIIGAHPEIHWNIVWETNRGCPNHCIYCDWGRHKAAPRQFSMERLTAELEWMCANKIEFIYCADANFGISKRDEEIVDALAAVRDRTGYPHLFNVNTAKIIDERLFRIVEKLNKSGLDRLGPNLAVQSLSPVVLHNIGRENFDDEMIALCIRRYRQAGYRTHTDLILGLPGETLQSFCAGVEKLFALGQHEGIQFFTCSLLPNASMAAPAYRKKHKIRTARRILKQTLECAPETEQIHEFIDIVVETADMPYADWLTANYFIFLTGSAHSYGLLRLIAMFLHTEKNVSYASFYLRLLAFCHEHRDTLPGEAMARMEKNFTDSLCGEESEPLQIPGFSFGRMFEEQYFFSRAVLEPDRFYADAAAFLNQFSLEPGLLEQLLRYQRESILMPGALEKILEFEYDFPAYFNAIYEGNPVPLQRKAVQLHFSFACDLSSTEKYYDTILQLGRYTSNAFYLVEERRKVE